MRPAIYTQNHSSCIKAASERIPRSVHKYVTGVSEESQRICSSKYEGDILSLVERVRLREKPHPSPLG